MISLKQCMLIVGVGIIVMYCSKVIVGVDFNPAHAAGVSVKIENRYYDGLNGFEDLTNGFIQVGSN